MAAKQLLALLMILCLLLPLSALSDVREEIEGRRDTSRIIDVPVRGKTQFYSQKNPRYAYMRYEYRESRTRRDFGEGGCAPTAAAMALAALLDAEELLVLNAHTADGLPFSLCAHAVNSWSCSLCPERLHLVTAEDFSVYLPVILGSYACGNNDLGVRWRRASRQVGGSGGTGAQFLLEICPLLGLECRMSDEHPDPAWLDELDENTVALFLSLSSPFTGNAHYVTAIAADEKYMYLLDPMEEYAYNKKHDDMQVLQVIEPGLVRVRRDMYKYMGIFTVYLISRPQS